MKLIDKDKVETILRNLWKEDDGHNSEHRICYNKALQEVQCEIDTLEVKPIDLEKEIHKFIDKEELHLRLWDVDRIAKHFFELGIKAAQKGE